MDNRAENYEEKIQLQRELLDKLADEEKRTPSDETKLKITRETDTLRHFTNAAKGDPQQRAQKAAESAKRVAHSRAVQQIAPDDAD